MKNNHPTPSKIPEECDGCGTSLSELKRYKNLRERHLCPYCANSFDTKETMNMASMFNVLESRLKEYMKAESDQNLAIIQEQFDQMKEK